MLLKTSTISIIKSNLEKDLMLSASVLIHLLQTVC